jgi:hypothetical protein
MCCDAAAIMMMDRADPTIMLSRSPAFARRVRAAAPKLADKITRR